MDKTTQLTQAPPTFNLTPPPKAWYDNSLSGVLLGFILGFGASLLKEFFQNRSKKKSMASNLLNEIGVQFSKAQSSIPEIREIKRRFHNISVGQTGARETPSDTPRLEYHGVEHSDYYKLYFKDLYLLDQNLQERITEFYSILKSIDGRSKTLASMFRDYYSGSLIVKSGDIIDQLDKLIGQYESLEVIGAEALGIIFYRYKKREVDNKGEDKEFEVKIREFIKSVGVGNTFELKKLCSDTNIGILTCTYILRELEGIKNESFGKYKVLSI